MASTFLYGPYAWVSANGAPAGAVHVWTFGPWSWYADAVAIVAHPIALAGADRSLKVTDIVARAAPDGSRFISCTVTNLGPSPANYAVWVGGVQP